MHLPGTTAPREPAWHHRKRKERSVARHIQWLGKELLLSQPVLQGHHGSASRSFHSMGNDGEWSTVAARRNKKDGGPPVKCAKPGCTGTCPRRVVEQGLRGTGFTPAKCQVCGRGYKLVPGAAQAPSERQRKGSAEKELREKLRNLEQKCNALEAAKTTNKADAPSASTCGDEPAINPLQASIKAAREDVAALRAMDPKLRDRIHGGYEVALAAAEAKRDECLAAKRGAAPLKEQMDKQQGYVDTNAKKLQLEQSKAEQLAKQQVELAAKIAEQATAVQAATAKLAAAKAELATISAKVAAENGQPGSVEGARPPAAVALLQSDAATRQALSDLCIFAASAGVRQALVDAGMPQDEQDRVTTALGTISQVATAAPPPLPEQQDDMELDDAQAEQMAEAVAEAKEGESKD